MRILVTLAFVNGFHGSVIHTLELASYLRKCGHDVTVCTIFRTPEISKIYEDRGISVQDATSIKIKAPFDVVLSFHFPVLCYLLYRFKGMLAERVVLWSLSGMILWEAYPFFCKADGVLLVSMSQRTAEKHFENYGVQNIRVIENFLPDEYIRFNKVCTNSNIKHIAVVSNHVPDEVVQACDKLNSCVGCETVYFGKGQKYYLMMTPELLSKFDLIVSIGKTIQYGLGLGIPVYEYDYFGGNGYISLTNFEYEKKHNFSGRPDCRKLSPDDIAREILEGYTHCREETGLLRDLAIGCFLLSKNVNAIMEEVVQSPKFHFNYTKNNELLLSQIVPYIVLRASFSYRNLRPMLDSLKQNHTDFGKFKFSVFLKQLEAVKWIILGKLSLTHSRRIYYSRKLFFCLMYFREPKQEKEIKLLL